MRNRASAHPSIESLEDMKVQVHTYDAEMGRTGGGVFNTTLKSGTNAYRGIGLLPDPADLGTVEQLLRREGRPAETRQPVLSGRRRRWRTDRQEPHVLLVHHRELPRRADAQRQHAVSDRGHAARRLLRRDQLGRAAGDDLQPGHRPAVCRQPDSVVDDEPGRGGHAASSCPCPTPTGTTAARTTRAPRASRAISRSCTRSSSSTSSPTASR